MAQPVSATTAAAAVFLQTLKRLGIAMAHGAYLETGRPQAVMVHVKVGTANAACGLINAAREEIPLILCAGRSPFTETGSTASRNASIHWAQEMLDRASMARDGNAPIARSNSPAPPNEDWKQLRRKDDRPSST